jgi:hypothetical protein
VSRIRSFFAERAHKGKRLLHFSSAVMKQNAKKPVCCFAQIQEKRGVSVLTKMRVTANSSAQSAHQTFAIKRFFDKI